MYYAQCAYRWGNKEVVEYLVKNPNVDPNSTDSSGMTPLYRACRYANLCSVHVRTFIVTSLYYSCGHKDIAECLLKGSNINPNLCEANGWTPLHWASEYVLNWLYISVQRLICTWYNIIQVGFSGYREDTY